MREKLLTVGVDVYAPLSFFTADWVRLDFDVLVAVQLNAAEVLVTDFSGDIVSGILEGTTCGEG